MSFEETYENGKPPKRPHTLHWDYREIQQLKLFPKSITIRAGGREYEFDLTSARTFEDALVILKKHMDERLMAGMAKSSTEEVLWVLPAKCQRRFGWDEGMLEADDGEVVFRSPKEDRSRTWRYQDIDGISRTGAFQLTITTIAGGKKVDFELKERLTDERFNDLCRRVDLSKQRKPPNASQC